MRTIKITTKIKAATTMSHVPPRRFAAVEFALRFIAAPLGIAAHPAPNPESLKMRRPFGFNRKALHLSES
jgi:hypothetical protein